MKERQKERYKEREGGSENKTIERERESALGCFKDVSAAVMKAEHNEAERPCSYLQSIKVINY